MKAQLCLPEAIIQLYREGMPITPLPDLNLKLGSTVLLAHLWLLALGLPVLKE